MYLELGMPKGVQVEKTGKLKNAFQILEELIKDKKYQRIYFAVGEDRVQDFNALYKYAKQWGEDIGLNVDFKIVKTGDRKKGISGTTVRNYAKDGDFEKFKSVLAKSLQKYAKEIYDKTRAGLGIK
jgi:hypothetical protein